MNNFIERLKELGEIMRATGVVAKDFFEKHIPPGEPNKHKKNYQWRMDW